MRFGILLFMLTVFENVRSEFELERTLSKVENGSHPHVLSRRKRYLLFPDGSSLQFVFCLQLSAVFRIAEIFLFGDTAALAWELPTDPKYFEIFTKNKHTDGKRRGDVINDLYELDSEGKIRARMHRRKKKFFHPTFAKRSVPDAKAMLSLKKRAMEINRKRMHEKQLKREYLKKEHMEEPSIRFHRSSRVGLFEKLEILFKTFGWNGRQCVLRKLCESSRHDTPQGTFYDELLRIIFSFPKASTYDQTFRKDYDSAHLSNENCATMYPDCPEFEVPSNVKFTLDNGSAAK